MKILNNSKIIKLSSGTNSSTRVKNLMESPVEAIEIQINNLVATYGQEVVKRALAIRELTKQEAS